MSFENINSTIPSKLGLKSEKTKEQGVEANKLGYTHLYGDAKYQEENKRKI